MLNCNNCKYPTACKVGLVAAASSVVGYLGYLVYKNYCPKGKCCNEKCSQQPKTESQQVQPTVEL